MNPLGHGVGLSICKQICRNLGGDITAKSRVNEGSTFTLTMNAIGVNKIISAPKTSTKRTHRIQDTDHKFSREDENDSSSFIIIKSTEN